MAKTSKTIVCHKCLETYPFDKKSFDWVETKSFKWVPAEVNNDHYKVAVCKECQKK